MGCFDTVMIRCPRCGSICEEQTKSGPCSLRDYQLDTAPMSVLQGVLGPMWCYTCKAMLIVELETKPRVIVREAREDEEDLF